MSEMIVVFADRIVGQVSYRTSGQLVYLRVAKKKMNSSALPGAGAGLGVAGVTHSITGHKQTK